MRKMIFLMLSLIVLSAASVKAQVNIGSNTDPHKGSLLDLSQSSSERGVLFPNVYLYNVNQFQLPDDAKVSPTGMVVYNSNPDLADGVGLYFWNGSEWKSMTGSTNSCVPVTATLDFSKSGSTLTFTVKVTAGNPAFSYVWYQKGTTTPVRSQTNVNATSDSYTTNVGATYSCQVSNPCTATPVTFTVTVGIDGTLYEDNGNGTYTNDQGELVIPGTSGVGSPDDLVYTPVESDIPGIYIDQNGDLVYAGADGIPGTADDDTYVIPDYPIGKQDIQFSIKYPVMVNVGQNYTMELDFADGSGSYTGKIKYLSSDPNLISVDANGNMTVNDGTLNMAATIVAILDDGSITTAGYTIRTTTPGNANKLDNVRTTDVTMPEQNIKRLGVTVIDQGNSVNAYNIKIVTYTIADDGGTGSTVTPGGWFHAGTSGTVTVIATAEAYDSGVSGTTYTKTGTITVTISGAPTPENQPYITASTNWANLEPAPAYAGGDGSQASPYQISSVRQLKKLASDISIVGVADVTYQKYFELTTDLDFSADNTVKQVLIGSFYGTFDGKGHVIKDLNIDATGKSNVAIFSSVWYTAEIKNFGREGGSTTGSGANYLAGLVVTLTHNARLVNCYNSSSINAASGAGGLVYQLAQQAIIDNCYNTGDVIMTATPSGGLVGITLYQGGNVTITKSYNVGNVGGSNNVGGCIGSVSTASQNQTLNLNNIFNFGQVTTISTDNRVGSVVGMMGSTVSTVNVNHVYSSPNVAFANNGSTPKPNQPLGWSDAAGQTFVNSALAANPTLGEDAKYTLDYSKTTDFVRELGSAFKFASGRSPKLAWEK